MGLLGLDGARRTAAGGGLTCPYAPPWQTVHCVVRLPVAAARWRRDVAVAVAVNERALRYV